MVAEVFGGIAALKAAFDITKGLKDIDDRTRLNAAIIELQERILSAQSAQAELVESEGELKKRVAQLEAWETEKQRYQLTEIGPAIFCYVLKPDMANGEPIHRLCANCYTDGKKAFLQQTVHADSLDEFTCNRCNEKLRISKRVSRPTRANTSWIA